MIVPTWLIIASLVLFFTDTPVYSRSLYQDSHTSNNDLQTPHENIADELPQPTLEKEKEKIEALQQLKLNFTALQYEIDNLLNVNEDYIIGNQSDSGSGSGSGSSDINRTTYNRKGKQFGGQRRLPTFLDRTLQFLDLSQVVKEVETSIMSRMSCTACKTGVGLLQHYVEMRKTEAEIRHAATSVCISLKIQSRRVCQGIIHLFAPEVIFILERLALSPKEICGLVIGDTCGESYNPLHEWQVVFPPIPKPDIHPIKPPQHGLPTLKVLHLSDTHFDPWYAEGSNAECGDPLCCRASQGFPRQASQRAGRWGDYRKCDTPLRTIVNMFEHISLKHPDIDYIIWTGDLPPHDIWNQSHTENLYILKETVNQLLHFFPGVPIFPALGNHESVPVNSFPPPFIQGPNSISWLYDELATQWQSWLPSHIVDTVRKGAYYSVKVHPGFRIISINMNYCNTKNWWLLLNSTDPAQELTWLIHELQAAEINHELVHIIGHIPPGHNDCLKVWSENYNRIVNRYESTIAAQFFGHTHYDEFELFYDDYGKPTSVAYIGPSVTPYYDLNPGYRIYTIDGDYAGTTKMVLDHENWIMDLDRANRLNDPRWVYLYSARAAYKMTSLFPHDWHQLINEMMVDKELFKVYYKFYWKASRLRPDCDDDCFKRMLCDLKSGRSHDRKVTCAHLEERIDQENSTSDWRSWLFSGLSLTYVFSSISNVVGSAVNPVVNWISGG